MKENGSEILFLSNNVMARTVRKVKRGKGKEFKLPAIVITPPEDMKLDKENNNVVNNVNNNVVQETNMSFNVNDLIAQLSQNSRASKQEIEVIQRKLLIQANEILKVNAFAIDSEPRVVGGTQKGSIYGKPITNQDTQMVPEKLQESEVNRRRVNMLNASSFFNGTSSNRPSSAHFASERGECL